MAPPHLCSHTSTNHSTLLSCALLAERYCIYAFSFLQLCLILKYQTWRIPQNLNFVSKHTCRLMDSSIYMKYKHIPRVVDPFTLLIGVFWWSGLPIQHLCRTAHSLWWALGWPDFSCAIPGRYLDMSPRTFSLTSPDTTLSRHFPWTIHPDVTLPPSISNPVAN